jgi:hypothetical protein
MMIQIPVFLIFDQPTTCPLCGCRTEIVFEFPWLALKPQINHCLSAECGYWFVEEEENIMGNPYGIDS